MMYIDTAIDVDVMIIPYECEQHYLPSRLSNKMDSTHSLTSKFARDSADRSISLLRLSLQSLSVDVR